MKPKVFVIMPINESRKDWWHFGIKATCERLGWACVRADELSEPGFIVSQIYRQIHDADLIIAEMTDLNPNVFYELGFAHALGKNSILLARSKEDLKAFDTNGLRHVFHGGSAFDLSNKLEKLLLDLDFPLEYNPTPPNAVTVYEWPSKKHPAPVFDWDHPHVPAGRRDVRGGQSLVVSGNGAEIIQLANTAENWNWNPGRSIMRLPPRTKDLRCGDRLILMIEGRADSAGHLLFKGDGARLTELSSSPWVTSWNDLEIAVRPNLTWERWTATVLVEPTHPEYDLARGTTFLILSSFGGGTAFYRRVLITRVPPGQ